MLDAFPTLNCTAVPAQLTYDEALQSDNSSSLNKPESS